MLKEDIKKFAVKQGFQDAEEIGKYKDYTAYRPIFLDGKARIIGYPQYILVKDESIQLKVDTNFEISKTLFPEEL